MAKHMAGKNQRPYSAEDRARRAAKADPRSAASELTPETLYAKQSSQSEKRVPSSIENLHFTPKSPKNGPEGFEETREYPVPAAPQQEAPRSERPAPAPAPRPEPYEDEDDYEEYEEYEEGYDEKPRRKRSPVVPIVIVMIVSAIGILGYIAYSLGAFGKFLPAAATPTPEPTPEAAATAEPTPTPTAEPTATPEPTPPPIYDDGTEGYMSSGILIYNNKGFEMFYGSDSMATAYAETLKLARATGLPVIADIKRGDIAKTAEMYAMGHFTGDFEVFPTFVTLAPYMGLDSISPYLPYAEKAGQGPVRALPHLQRRCQGL